MPDIHPAQRAEYDRELSSAIDGLMGQAAQFDGVDVIEASMNLTNRMLAELTKAQIAVAAGALAIHLHRSGRRG